MTTKKRRRRTFAKPTVAARLEPEVHREFMRDCEAGKEKVADKLRFIVREHYKSKRRKLEGQEEMEDPVRELYRQTLAEELAPLKAALSYLADLSNKVTNLEELLIEIKTSDGSDAGSEQCLQGSLSPVGQGQNVVMGLLQLQSERLGYLIPIILAQHRLINILHVKAGSAYHLLKFVATNPECTGKNQEARRKYLEAMYLTWENQLTLAAQEIGDQALQEASCFQAGAADEVSPDGIMQDSAFQSQLSAEGADPERISA